MFPLVHHFEGVLKNTEQIQQLRRKAMSLDDFYDYFSIFE